MPKASPYDHLTNRQAQRMLRALDTAVAHCGGFAGLAAAIAELTNEKISAQAVFRWAVAGVPAERAVQIERATGAVVLRQNLRPDLYDGMRFDD